MNKIYTGIKSLHIDTLISFFFNNNSLQLTTKHNHLHLDDKQQQ